MQCNTILFALGASRNFVQTKLCNILKSFEAKQKNLNLFYKVSVGGLTMFSMIWSCVRSYVVPTRVTCTLITFTCLHCNSLIIRCNTLFFNNRCLSLGNKDPFLLFTNSFPLTFSFASCPNVCFHCWLRENMPKKEKKRYMHRLSPDNIKFNLFEGVFFSFLTYFDSYATTYV